MVQRGWWLTWDRHAGSIGSDQDESRGFLHRLSEIGREPVVPAPPQCRLIWDSLEAEVSTESRPPLEVLDECGLVVPAVEFFEEKRTQ
jgi:hypothetical protein